MVRGVSKGLPPAMDIWVFVYSASAREPRYYPQGSYPNRSGPVRFTDNRGDWVSPDVFIGNDSDVGTRWDILAVLVDSHEQNALWEYLKTGWDPTQHGKPGDFAGYTALPFGATKVASVQVIRK